jgi:hypothetical protein
VLLADRAIRDERSEHAVADVRTEPEEALCLTARETQAWHLDELGAHSAEQLLA